MDWSLDYRREKFRAAMALGVMIALVGGCGGEPDSFSVTGLEETREDPFVNDRTERSHLPVQDLVAALEDENLTNGTLLVGVKEPFAVRGVSTTGVALPPVARIEAENAIRNAFPSMEVVQGVRRIVTARGTDGLRTDTIHRTAITVRPGSDASTLIQELLAHPNVDYVSPNYWNGVLLGSTGILETMSIQTRPWSVDSVRAPVVWNDGYDGDGSSVGVADTGADFEPSGHPDLAFVGLSGMFTNFVDHQGDNPCTSFSQLCWWEDPLHGTGVLGSAMALDDGEGSVGSAPNNATPLVTKVGYTSSSGAFRLPEADFADAVLHITDSWDIYTESIRVAVTSVGYNTNNTGLHPTLHDAFKIASQEDNVLWFAAAGNNNGGHVVVPAAFPEVVAVSALSPSLGIASFSSRGPEVELAAPGEDVRISWNRQGDDCCSNEYTVLQDGTSFAAPLAAGVARLALDKFPTWSASQLRQELRDHARDLGTAGKDDSYGYGLIDAVCITRQLAPCSPLGVTIGGPNNISTSGYYTWEAFPDGGNGSYGYAWEYCPNGGSCQSVGSQKTYTRWVDETEPLTFDLRVTVTSGAEEPAEDDFVVFNNTDTGGVEAPRRPPSPGSSRF